MIDFILVHFDKEKSIRHETFVSCKSHIIDYSKGAEPMKQLIHMYTKEEAIDNGWALTNKGWACPDCTKELKL